MVAERSRSHAGLFRLRSMTDGKSQFNPQNQQLGL